MAQSMRPISTVTDSGNFTGATAHGSVDGTAPDTGDYWNGNDNQDDVLEVLLTDLSATTPAAGTCTVSIYETDSDTDSAPAGSAGTAPTYDIEVYEGATQRAARTGITPTSGTFTLDNALTFAAADITDWSDVRARFTSYGTGGNPANRRGAAVSFIEISTPDASSDYELTTNAPQALTLTEQTATLTHDVNITTTAPQALVVATYTADITVPVNVDVTTTDPQALTLTEQAATVTHDVSITTTAPQALSVTEQTSTITHDVNITTEAPQALSITPQTATVSYGVNIEANAPQALTLTEQTATLAHDVNITTGSPQALGITPQTATLTHDVNVTTTAPQALSLTEQTATVTHDVSITTTAPQALTLTENTATLAYDVNVTTGSPQALTLATYTATVEIGSSDVEITTTAPQALSLTEQTATLTHDVSITTGAPQALSVTTYTAGVAFGSVDVEVTTTAPQVLSLATHPATVAAVSPLGVPGSTFTTFAITNTGASADSGNKYNVCQLTGFKQVRDSLSTTWNGVKVRPESYDIRPPQLNVSVKAEELSGPVRPEPADVFVSTSTAPSDL